ncbi:iron donor protein CyaY [Porticoccus litoralis]|uniref:Iron-sulfur cluster assembly protein CyaY n=1 Tax=Porticoccus litoralis TaxID=434086 RepID=A0AAW8B3K9_9GAMM|nr:iron donor protein CyaY [Porticoccus litoralis]MDP1520332.1 iron donor protein CyaY [Porticoccus litoralis]
MNETEFSDLADDLMLLIEESLDNCGVDIDYETSAGVMTLTIEADDSKVIISRQPAMSQIWVAAKSGGYHFNFDGVSWQCSTTGETLPELLSRVCSEQAGEAVELNF